MGIVTMGVPADITLELAQLAGAKVFIETGTYHGGTSRWAARHFERVITIEKAESLYRLQHEELRRLGNVEPWLGDSRDILPKVLATLQGQPAVFWLDGHWSGGETAGADDPCPLMDELRIVSPQDGHVILIDDARLFLSVHYEPYDPAQWPTITEIVHRLTAEPRPRFLQIVDDVIFAVANEGPVKDRLVAYSQQHSPAFWQTYSDLLRARRRGLVRRLVKNARGLFQRT